MTERTYTREDLARAWTEGAEVAWLVTGEGWNGEYAGKHGTHDGGVSFAQANNNVPNPYERKES